VRSVEGGRYRGQPVPTRIDVELTSARPDGLWTWRAAGAREPRGVVDAALLPQEAQVGDVLKVEANVSLDGIDILTVVPAKSSRKEPERLEVIGSEREVQPITTSLARREGRDRRRERPDRRDSGDRPRGERASREGTRERSGERADGERRPRRERPARPPRPQFTPPPELPQRPKPKRLRAGRAHRNELVLTLPVEQRPIAEQLLRGGLPAVRQALSDQNDALRAEGKLEIKAAGIEALAQDLLPGVRVAEWLDRADAAKTALDELDLRDLRSVVTAAADPAVARDESVRVLAEELRAGLDRRQDEEHQQWLADIEAALGVGRVVRALRLSSRPPKAGVPFPAELASRLADATTASLTADAPSDRWTAVVEALAFSPVHAQVTPAAPPAEVGEALRTLVTSLAGAVPEIAKLLGIEPAPPGSRPPRPPRLPRRPAGARKPKRPSPEPAATAAPEPTADA
jgi:hypothetical protein